jgi:hypothetical protein
MCNYSYSLTIQIIDFKEEFNLIFRRLTRELMHGVNEFLECDCAGIVLVENLENSLGEEGLNKN